MSQSAFCHFMRPAHECCQKKHPRDNEVQTLESARKTLQQNCRPSSTSQVTLHLNTLCITMPNNPLNQCSMIQLTTENSVLSVLYVWYNVTLLPLRRHSVHLLCETTKSPLHFHQIPHGNSSSFVTLSSPPTKSLSTLNLSVLPIPLRQHCPHALARKY